VSEVLAFRPPPLWKRLRCRLLGHRWDQRGDLLRLCLRCGRWHLTKAPTFHVAPLEVTIVEDWGHREHSRHS
jgi:hypothetical protein